ncbi:MAG: hypothetical protein Q7U57_17800 [Methylovulum sp.]|nr:hypothetical protein [Methylovulum sp.]
MNIMRAKIILAMSLSIVTNLAVADISGMLLACAKGGYAKENRPPAYLNKQVFGANMLFFSEQDTLRGNPSYQEKMRAGGFGSLRFPGGTVADNYHWATGETVHPTRRPVRHIRSDNDLSFDEFIALSKDRAAEPSIVLNYLSWAEKNQLEAGYKEAASWVNYANLEKNYGVKYWELGNEVYYFTAGKHINVRARAYARDYKAMEKLLHGIDAKVQLGAAMPQKLHWTAQSDSEPWWDAFLDEVGGDLDYIVLHNYSPLTVDAYLAGGTGFPELLQSLRRTVKDKIGHTVPIHVTEWNIGEWDKRFIAGDSVWQGLYVAETLLDFSVNDVRLATFWPLRSKNGYGLFSNDGQQYFAGGQVFKLLAPYQGQQVLFDCSNPTLRIARLAESQGNAGGALIMINKGPAQQIDIAALLGNDDSIAGLSTFVADNGKYIVKAYLTTELKAFGANNSKPYLIPSESLVIFKLNKLNG